MTTAITSQQELSQLLDECAEAVRRRVSPIDRAATQKLEIKFTRALSLYFKRLAKNFPYEKLSGYVEQYGIVKEASAEETAARKMVAGVLVKQEKELTFVLDDLLR